MASKFLKIGQVRLVEPKGKDPFEVMELENANLQEFIKLLREFGKNKIGDKDQKEIRAAQKLKREDPAHLKRIGVRRFNKTDEDRQKGCPDFILADLCVSLDDFE